jgi:hypothetical protein
MKRKHCAETAAQEIMGIRRWLGIVHPPETCVHDLHMTEASARAILLDVAMMLDVKAVCKVFNQDTPTPERPRDGLSLGEIRARHAP